MSRWMFKVFRATGKDVKDLALQPGEWAWVINENILVTGDGQTKGGIRDKYRGGLITFRGGAVGQPVIPPTIPLDILQGIVLEVGEVVYCPEKNWIYIGDGQTKGGIKAK